MLLFSGCVSVQGCGFSFWLVYFCFLFLLWSPSFWRKTIVASWFWQIWKIFIQLRLSIFFNLSVSGLTCKCNLWRVEEWVVLYSRNFKIQRRDGNENVNKTNRFSGQKVLDTFLCNFFGGFARLGRENSLFYFLRRT